VMSLNTIPAFGNPWTSRIAALNRSTMREFFGFHLAGQDQRREGGMKMGQAWDEFLTDFSGT